MKNIMLIMCFMVCYTISAQTIQFNKLYYTDTTRELSPCVLVAPDSNYIVAGISRGPSSRRAIYARKIDQTGNIVWQTDIDMTDTSDVETYSGGAMIRTIDNNYALISTRSNIEKTRYNILLSKFTDKGHILWQQQYSVPDTLDIPYAILQTIKGDYVIAGYAMHNSYTVNANVLMIKTDSLGSILWRKQTSDYSGATIFHAEQTTDGGYIVSGYNYHNETGYDMYAIKTDSLGNVQWEQNYGTDGDDGSCRVIEIAPNQYALLGIIAQEDVFAPMWTTETQQIFARLDSTGNIINGSVNLFFSQQHNSFNAAYFDPKEQTIVAISLTYTPNPTQPYLDKFSLSGERLLHVPLSTGIGMEDYLRDVEPTPDGGYVLAGFNFKTPSKGWVVKVDSLGNSCGLADCDNYVEPVGMAAVDLERERVFAVYPNPAQDYLVVENNSQEQNLSFVLYDVVGRVVLQQSVSTQNSIATQHLPSGVYLYQFLNPQKQILTYGKVSIVR